MLVSLLLTRALAADVLILWDTQERGVPAIQTALVAGGHSVTLSDTIQYEYDGTNPSLAGFDVVIHLNGDTYDNDMPESGQQALLDFVAAGGGFLHEEWNAYTHDEAGKYTLLADLTLIQRASYTGNMGLWSIVAGQEGHPVVAGGNIEVTGTGNYGSARVFEEDPSVVLMRMDGGYDAVVAREWREGRVVGLAVAGTWNNEDPYSDGLLGLLTNAVGWLGDCDRDADGVEREFCGGPDCDDTNAAIGAPGTWYADADSDGYGVAPSDFCADPGEGWAAAGDDCDDADADANPGATEVPWDGVDQDCDGLDLCDVDGDGADAEDCGGDDCDDEDADVAPDAAEVPDDGVDQDCDGEDETSPADTGSEDTGDGAAAAGGCGCSTGADPTALTLGVGALTLLLRRRRAHR